MAQMLSIVLGLASIIWAFFSPVWAWAPVAFVAIVLLVVLFSVKQKKWKRIDDLSPLANELLQRFGHYYAMPFGARDFSAAASTMQFAVIAVAIIGVFNGFWWGLLLAGASWCIFGPVAMAFNPTNFLRDPMHQLAHDEIVEWITSSRRK